MESYCKTAYMRAAAARPSNPVAGGPQQRQNQQLRGDREPPYTPSWAPTIGPLSGRRAVPAHRKNT